LQPQSPMVTPPTRSYQRTAALDTTVSIGVANSSNSSAPVSARRSSAGSAAAATVAGLPYTIVSVGVPHVYRDHSQLPDDDSFIRKKTGGVTQPFPEKLQEMLRAVDGTENAEIVSWLPHGRAFLVRKPKEFTEVIMPK
jgi:HSF-type DNA-binding